MSDNNKVTLTGVIYKFFEFSHETQNEKYYRSEFFIDRLDNDRDRVPVMIPERFLEKQEEFIGKHIKIRGRFRSFSTKVRNDPNKKCRLDLYVMIKSIERCVSRLVCDLPNRIVVEGHICSTPSRRRTPSGKDIADVVIAVDRRHGKADFLPCILWGENAAEAATIPAGTRVKLWGRIQSREYEKRLGDEIMEKRVAYEVSAGRIQQMKDIEMP